MKSFKRLGLLLLVIILLIVVLQNTGSVRTILLFFPVEMPLALLLFVTLLAGVALGIALSGRTRKGAK